MQATRNIEKEYFMIRLMTFFRYFGDCLFYGYFAIFLAAKGLTESNIGFILAVVPIVALASNPLWNHMSKNANHNRKIMMIITILEGIAILLFTQVNAFEFLALITVMLALVGSPFYALHDGFIGTFATTYKKDYTKIRYLGTAAYFSGSLFAALLLWITKENYNILLMFSGIIFILVSAFFISIKPIDLTLTKGGEKVERNYKAILTNKTFGFYMVIYFLVNTISFAADSYVGLYFTKYHGLSSSLWSLILASFVLIEFVVMLFLSKRSERINPNLMWVLISILYPLRSLLFAFNIPLPVAVAASLLRGFSYGIMLVVNIRCIEKICGIENVTAAYFILAIFNSIIQAVSHLVLGNVLENIGFQMFFLIVGMCGFVGMVLNLIYQIKHKFTYEIK